MNIYAALKRDHQKLEGLLNQLVESSNDKAGDWKELVNQIRDELIPHSRVEEALFYNPLRETEHGRELVMHSYQEHAMAETELRSLQAMAVIDVNWTALAEKLRKDILHHVEEEEGKVFEAAKLVFDSEESENIGVAFEQLKPEVRKQSILGTSADLMINLLPENLRTKIQTSLSKAKKRAA